MKNFVKNTTDKIKNHVQNHRFGYGLMTGATLAVAIEISRARQMEAYLVEKGIDLDDYYDTGDEEVETQAQ